MAIISSGAFAQSKQNVLTLETAVKSALNASPTYITAKNSLEVANLEAENAAAVFYPNLDLSASHGVRGIDPDATGLTARTPIVSGTTLTLTENLYDNGESYKRHQIADYRYELAKINFQRSKAQVIRSVALAYYRYVLATQNLEFTRKNFNELERLGKLVTNQFYQGLKTRKDFLSFKTRTQRSRLEVLDAERTIVSSRTELLTLIGYSPNDPVVLDTTVRPVLPKGPLTTQISNEDLFEARGLSLQREIGALEVKIAKRKYWPELSLVGAASYGSSAYIDTGRTWDDNDVSQWSVLLNLKFNIIDWGIRSRNIKIAASNSNSDEQAAREDLLQAQRDLEVFKLEVARAEETYRLSKELQKLEEDTFKLLERDYRSGQTTYLELVTGLANLLDAQARGQQADYRQADLYLRWKYYKGTLSEETLFE